MCTIILVDGQVQDFAKNMSALRQSFLFNNVESLKKYIHFFCIYDDFVQNLSKANML